MILKNREHIVGRLHQDDLEHFIEERFDYNRLTDVELMEEMRHRGLEKELVV